jgi:hypothetical protein
LDGLAADRLPSKAWLRQQFVLHFFRQGVEFRIEVLME